MVDFLQQNEKEITTSEEISPGGHSFPPTVILYIGQLLASAMEKVGKEGVITVKEGKDFGRRELEVTEGMFDRGYISPYFITNTKNGKVEFENPLIMSSEKKISSIQDILPSLELSNQTRRPLLIIATKTLIGEACCLYLEQIGVVKFKFAVKAPGFGDNM